MKPRISITIADDHPLVLTGLVAVLENHFEILGIAENGRELLGLIRQRQPSIAIIDFYMPDMNGVQVSRSIKKDFPAVKCVILSSGCDITILNDLKGEILSGYLSKEIHATKLVSFLNRIAAGEFLYERGMDLTPASKIVPLNLKESRISSRELEIMELIRKGYTSLEISCRLFISVNTVEAHRKNIYKKLSVKNLQGLLEYMNTNI